MKPARPTVPATRPLASPDRAISVYLVDDHAMLRAAFRGLIEQDPALRVVGDRADARGALPEIARLAPDVVLLDITMPGLSGIDAIPAIREASPNARILMLTHHEGESFVKQALAQGADGYLSKDSDPQELHLGIRTVAGGRPYLSPKVAAVLVAARTPGAVSVHGRSGIDTLTAREREVFLLLALGKANKQVARELGITVPTAKKHRENLQRKLDCHSTAALARLAIREGLLGSY